MATTKKSDIKLDKDPRSTFGATQAYKDAWFEEYGKEESARLPEAVDAEEAAAENAEQANTVTGSTTGTGTGSGSTSS